MPRKAQLAYLAAFPGELALVRHAGHFEFQAECFPKKD